MSEHTLHLHAADEVLDTNDFLWADGPSASFRTNISAALSEFPGGRRPNRDLLRLAVLVFLVDRTRRRPKRWARDLKLDVPMERPKAWIPHSADLERMLGFLTGDRWTLGFHFAKRPDVSADVTPCPIANAYMLLSGGADSLTG